MLPSTEPRMKSSRPCLLSLCLFALGLSAAEPVSLTVSQPMRPPKWAQLERQLLAANVPACREFYQRYFDERGYLQIFVRWGANDGPDDAFENFNRWPELHALGADDEILQLFMKGHEGLIKQYTEAKTVEVPIAREGMYYKEFIVQSDWMHHGEGLQLFNRMGLCLPADAKYQERARRFAGFYMNEDPEAQNYDPKHKIIRSLLNGSKGPMLRPATAIDWVGDPFDVTGFKAVHGEKTWPQFVAHYNEYTDVAGDNCLNLAATTLPMNAYLLANEAKYKQWLLEYMDAWVDRMKQNGGVIPSYIDLEGRIGGPEGKWWGNAYGWGFSPLNPVTGVRNNRHRIPRALVGFNNALLVTGDQKYVDAWRNMIRVINTNTRTNKGVVEYPTMHNEKGWYGWTNRPWDIGALEVWYWSQNPADLPRKGEADGWLAYLQGKNTKYPETALAQSLELIQKKLTAMRRDHTPPEKRLADNMLDYNPASVSSLIRLMQGGLIPGRDGGLLNARLRYFDPVRKRAGVPEDVAALISEMSDTRTVVTLVNLSKTETRKVIVQGGAYGEHQLESVTVDGKSTSVHSPLLQVELKPGAGEKLILEMKRYALAPTVKHPWQRR
jgi:hypothetical protein